MNKIEALINPTIQILSESDSIFECIMYQKVESDKEICLSPRCAAKYVNFLWENVVGVTKQIHAAI